jgi:hypothetical protein
MSKTLELAQQREQLPFAEAHGAERKRIVIRRNGAPQGLRLEDLRRSENFGELCRA